MGIPSKWGILFIAILLLALLALMACGDDEETTETPGTTEPTMTAEPTEPPVEDVPIKIGLLTDKTGPASQALIPVDTALRDVVKYFEEKNLIPGVDIKIIDYDTQYDPANIKPGYEKLKSDGADVFVSGVPAAGGNLKPFLDDDKMVFFSLTADETMYNPPGYVFGVTIPTDSYIYTMMSWIAENDWDYETNGPAKIGGAAWNLPYGEEQQLAAKEYSNAHPDQFKWVAGHLTEFTPTWAPVVESLKDCDYIIPPATGVALPQFIREYSDAGYEAKYIGTDAQMAYFGLMTDGVGWDAIDGMIMGLPYKWWSEEGEVLALAKYALENYHGEGKSQELKWSGGSYRGGFTQWYGVLTIIKEAVAQSGPEGFDSQALYATTTSFSHDFDGNVWDYSSTDRTTWQSLGVFEVCAEEMDLVRMSDVWVTVLMTP